MSEPINLEQHRASRNLTVVDGGLNSGGGGGTSDGMEARVTKLETTLADFRVDTAKQIGDVRTELATISERVSHLPSKEYISTRLLGLLAAIAALILFADKVKAWFGLH